CGGSRSPGCNRPSRIIDCRVATVAWATLPPGSRRSRGTSAGGAAASLSSPLKSNFVIVPSSSAKLPHVARARNVGRKHPRGGASHHDVTTIGVHGCSDVVGALLGRQEHGRRRDLVHLAGAADRQFAELTLLPLF